MEMHTSQHRFSGNLRVIATTSQGEESLGVACEYDKQKVVVFALGYSINPNRFKQDMKFKVEFRAEQNPIITTAGMAISQDMLWAVASPDMIDQLTKAKEVKFLASNLDKNSVISFDWAFKTSNAADIVAKLLKACDKPQPIR
jgi:hypothetical protein